MVCRQREVSAVDAHNALDFVLRLLVCNIIIVSFVDSLCELLHSMAELVDTYGSDLSAERYNVVLAFLCEQEILCPDDFIGLRPFAEMSGVDALHQQEIKILETIAADVQGKSSRKRVRDSQALCNCIACARC